jgi:uncharacterized membrane protein YdbT with pleckstrin-like domain
MSFIEKNLSANEQILYKGKIHWYIYLRCVIFFIIGFLTSDVSMGFAGFMFFLGIISLILAIMNASSTEFAITNKRVILKTGVLKRKFIELQLNKSEGLRIEQGIIGRIFNFGTIKITSAGVTEDFKYLTKPFEFKKRVNNAIEGAFNPVVSSVNI